MGLNRTFMELKSSSKDSLNATLACLNRTFMELKYQKIYADFYRDSRLNRTFMELKSELNILLLRQAESQSYLYGIEISV